MRSNKVLFKLIVFVLICSSLNSCSVINAFAPDNITVTFTNKSTHILTIMCQQEGTDEIDKTQEFTLYSGQERVIEDIHCKLSLFLKVGIWTRVDGEGLIYITHSNDHKNPNTRKFWDKAEGHAHYTYTFTDEDIETFESHTGQYDAVSFEAYWAAEAGIANVFEYDYSDKTNETDK